MRVEEYRQEIDKVDDKIAELFEKRLDLCKKIAEEKKESKMAVSDMKREEDIIKRLKEKNPEGAVYIEDLYRKIFIITKELELQVMEED